MTSAAHIQPITQLTAVDIPKTLEQILEELQMHGEPRIGVINASGWHCAIDVSITVAGGRFQVSSEFKHSTPMAAAIQCRDRLRTALKQLGAKA